MPPGLPLETTEISIHASRGGSDIRTSSLIICTLIFQSTLPAGEATQAEAGTIRQAVISIHASRGGSDHGKAWHEEQSNISIHASRGGSDLLRFRRLHHRHFISIHASRGGSDLSPLSTAGLLPTISIHASRGGSDIKYHSSRKNARHFNPRFPRGKRHYYKIPRDRTKNFNPRFPRGKRHI